MRVSKVLNHEYFRDKQLSVKVDQYCEYMKQCSIVSRWQQKLSVLQQQFQDCKNKYNGYYVLRKKFTEAEILTMDTAINSINEHTAYYLSTFFPEHHLSAVLESSRDKNHNLKISSSLEFKGNAYDNISQLSGGEFDRCTLASICGINSMLNSPFLILDESLSALDSDTNTEIIHFFDALAENKLILVCSHEAITGIFNHVVSVE